MTLETRLQTIRLLELMKSQEQFSKECGISDVSEFKGRKTEEILKEAEAAS